MSGLNTPPPSPTTRKPLRQSVQEIREGNAPQSPQKLSEQQSVAPQTTPQPPVTDFSKIKKVSNVIPPTKRVEEPQQPVVNPSKAPTSPQRVAQEQSTFTPTPPPTYYEGGDERGGYIEFDLQSYRQRGVEERFLNISVVGILEDLAVEDQDIVESAIGNGARNTMRISDRAQFDALKNFFNSLEWED